MGIKQLNNDNLRKLPNEYGDVSVRIQQIWPGLALADSHRVDPINYSCENRNWVTCSVIQFHQCHRKSCSNLQLQKVLDVFTWEYLPDN